MSHRYNDMLGTPRPRGLTFASTIAMLPKDFCWISTHCIAGKTDHPFADSLPRLTWRKKCEEVASADAWRGKAVGETIFQDKVAGEVHRGKHRRARDLSFHQYR